MQRTYPHGVPCWVDLETSDLDAAREFYGQLFGWAFENVLPAGAPGAYLVASVDGAGLAALAPGEANAWTTYVAVDDIGSVATSVGAEGGQVLDGPVELGPPGSTATCADPSGARFRLWQAGTRKGAQLVNAPTSWNFSNLRVADAAVVRPFYASVFGWEYDDVPGLGTSVRVAGYGRHLADTVDPGIYERQSFAPDGFEDVVAAIEPLPDGEQPHWHPIFAVADRDASADAVRRLGGTVHSTSEDEWTRTAEVSDPQGARCTLSQFTPPG